MQEKPKATQYKHVYIIVRRDIPQPHIAVQVAHAGIAAAVAFGVPVRHPNLVVCAVENEQELDDLFNHLKEIGVQCCAWYEDDMGNALTAIATAALEGSQRKPLRRLKLLQ